MILALWWIRREVFWLRRTGEGEAGGEMGVGMWEWTGEDRHI